MDAGGIYTDIGWLSRLPWS